MFEHSTLAAYDRDLNAGLSLSGESRDHFARERVQWLRGCLRSAGLNKEQPAVMDFGCGPGATLANLHEILNARQVVGVDPSRSLLDVGRKMFHPPSFDLITPEEYSHTKAIDVAYCNGVFHHLSDEERKSAVEFLFRILKPGGVLSLWENNPYSLAARWVMSRIPFDKDAEMVWPRSIIAILRRRGFQLLRLDYLFVFPNLLHRFRWIEPFVSKAPFGAQYQVFMVKGTHVIT